MTFPERIQWVLNLVFSGNKKTASSELGINPSTIHRWLDEEYKGTASISIETIGRMYLSGVNPVWVAAELGERYADNKKGRELREKLGGKFEEPEEEGEEFEVDETAKVLIPIDKVEKLDEIHAMLKELTGKK